MNRASHETPTYHQPPQYGTHSWDPVMIPWDKCTYTCLDTSACCFMFFKHVEWTLHSLSNNLWPNNNYSNYLGGKSVAFGCFWSDPWYFRAFHEGLELLGKHIDLHTTMKDYEGYWRPLRNQDLGAWKASKPPYYAVDVMSKCNTRRGQAAIAIDFTTRKTLAWCAFAVHGHAFQTFTRLSLSTTSQQHQDQPCGPTHHQTHSTMHVLWGWEFLVR